MLDQHLWMTHFHMREKQLMREAEDDRLANEHVRTRTVYDLFASAMREAAAIIRARITSQALANKGMAKDSATVLSDAQPLMVSEEKSPILAEAEEIVRACCADPVE